MSSPNVIRPCTPQFHPQTTVKRIVTSATADSVYFLSGVHLYAMNAGTGALQWGLLISDARSRLSWEGEDPEQHLPPPPAPGAGPRMYSAYHDFLVGLAIQNNRVFVTSRSFTFALAADSGELLWEHYTRVNHDRPAVVGDTVYVPSSIIHALSTHDGSERWSYRTAWNSGTSVPVIDTDFG